MRVLMISKACVVGIYQRKLEQIAALGVDLMLVVPPVWADKSGAIPLERAHMKGYQVAVIPPRFNGNYHLHVYPGLGRLIQEWQPDIVHSDEEPYNLATWQALWHARRIGAKTLYFSWQNICRRYPPPFSWGERWVLYRADQGIMGTESAAEVFRAKGHRGGLTVIPQFGVDLADFPFRPHTIDPQGERDGAERVVGFIGRLVPEKGVDLLLRAAQEVIAGGQAIRLMIVGQGSEREALERLAATLGIAEQVTFFGHVPSLQMPTLYPQLDVLCLPSRTLPTWKEQFGRVILEAMASGVPVIGSDSGAIPDVIGDAGVIVPEENPHALAEALRGLLSDPARHADLAQKGRARVEAYFTHQRIAEATVRVYERLWRKPL